MVIHSKASAAKMHRMHSKILDLQNILIPDTACVEVVGVLGTMAKYCCHFC